MTVAILLLACVLLAVAAVALAVALRRQRDETADAVAALRAEQAVVERRLAALESPGEAPDRSRGFETGASAPSSTDGREYVITRLGEAVEEPPAPTLEGRLFADIVLRESVVKAASFAYGVRRGLSPANRNRIWFEMRREVKRARKDRRAEERQAIREWRARQRAAVRDKTREDDAA